MFNLPARLGGWQVYAAGAALVFVAGLSVGNTLGGWRVTADLSPQLTDATAEIARLNLEKAITATTALETLNELAANAQEARAAAEIARDQTRAAADEFRTSRAASVTQGHSGTCVVSDDDAAAAGLLDSRLFPDTGN